MSLPTHATTYQLSRDQVSGQQASTDRERALKLLAAAGIPASVETDGVIRGVLSVEPQRFETLPGAPIGPRQAFEVVLPRALRFADPSPLSQLGDLPILEATSAPKLVDKLIRAWSQRLQLIEAAVLAARAIAPNAQLYGDPWRIEGELSFDQHVVRLMFSPRGDRACVCAIDGRPVDRAPVGRKVIPVDGKMPKDVWHELLAAAIEQAKPCLGPPVVSRDERQLSIDLASRDLDVRPVERPASGTATLVSPPPRWPPPRHPTSSTVPTVVSGPPQLPRPHLATNPRSLPLKVDDDDVLVSVALSSDDLP